MKRALGLSAVVSLFVIATFIPWNVCLAESRVVAAAEKPAVAKKAPVAGLTMKLENKGGRTFVELSRAADRVEIRSKGKRLHDFAGKGRKRFDVTDLLAKTDGGQLTVRASGPAGARSERTFDVSRQLKARDLAGSSKRHVKPTGDAARRAPRSIAPPSAVKKQIPGPRAPTVLEPGIPEPMTMGVRSRSGRKGRVTMPASANRAVQARREGVSGGNATPFSLDEGIDIATPSAGAVLHAGGSTTVRYRVTRDHEVGDVGFVLMQSGGGDGLAETTDNYRPSFGEGSGDTGPATGGLEYREMSWNLPSSLPAGSGYYIVAYLDDRWGMSDEFSIEVIGEGQAFEGSDEELELVHPAGPAHWHVPSTQRIHWNASGFERNETPEVYLFRSGEPQQRVTLRDVVRIVGGGGRGVLDIPTGTEEASDYRLRIARGPIADEKGPIAIDGTPPRFRISHIFNDGMRVRARVHTQDEAFSGMVPLAFRPYPGGTLTEVTRLVEGAQDEVLLETVEPTFHPTTGALLNCRSEYEATVDPDNTYGDPHPADNTFSRDVFFSENHGFLSLMVGGRSLSDGDTVTVVRREDGSWRDTIPFQVRIESCSWENRRGSVTYRQRGFWPEPGTIHDVGHNIHLGSWVVDIDPGEIQVEGTVGTGYPPVREMRPHDSDIEVELTGSIISWARDGRVRWTIHVDFDPGLSPFE